MSLGVAVVDAAPPAGIVAACVAAYIGLAYRSSQATAGDAKSLQEAIRLLHQGPAETKAQIEEITRQLTVLGFDLNQDIGQVLSRLEEIEGLARLQGQADEAVLDYLKKHDELLESWPALRAWF